MRFRSIANPVILQGISFSSYISNRACVFLAWIKKLFDPVRRMLLTYVQDTPIDLNPSRFT